MDEFFDTYLSRRIKNWAVRHQAPAHVRGRLLWLASQPPVREKLRDLQVEFQIKDLRPVHWEHFLLTCDIIHSCQNGLSVSRLVI